MNPQLLALCVAGGMLVMIFVFVCIWASRIVQVPPNAALIITGDRVRYTDPKTGRVMERGFRIVKGGRAFVWPILQKADFISMEVLTVDLGEGTLLAKITGSESAISAAAEHYLSKSKEEMEKIVRELITPHLQRNPSFGDPLARAEKIKAAAAPELERTGLEVVSLILKT